MIIWICFTVAFFSALATLFIFRLIDIRIEWMKLKLPPNFQFQLPNFNGRIFPAYKVQPGTFTISADFLEVESWGPESILTFDLLCYENTRSWILLKAWRPDSKTQGVFELAIENIPLPIEWKEKGYIPYNIKLDGNTLVVGPDIEDEFVGKGWVVLCGFITISSFIAGIIAYLI